MSEISVISQYLPQSPMAVMIAGPWPRTALEEEEGSPYSIFKREKEREKASSCPDRGVDTKDKATI